MIQSTTEPAAAASAVTAEAPVCAVLCLPTVKSARTQRVLGMAGKPYEFKWSEAHQMLVREYRSVEVFHREEADLRKNQRNIFMITTRLGSTHPVANAREAVTALIGAGRQVPLDTRRAALQAIIEESEAAIAAMASPEDEPAPTQAPAPTTEPRKAVEMPPTWKGEDGAPIPTAEPTGELVSTLPAGASRYTQEQLMTADISSLRELAKGLGLSLTGLKGGQKGRLALVPEIIALQDAKR